MKKTRFVLEAQYDPLLTDPEGLASAMNRLLETAHFTPGILDDHGNPSFSEFAVTELSDGREVATRYILYDFDSDDLATTTVYRSHQEAADDASRLDNVMILTLSLQTSTGETFTHEEPCECEEPGYFCSGVPGILAHVEDGRLAEGEKVERCDACCLYPSDEAALAKLIEFAIAQPNTAARPD